MLTLFYLQIFVLYVLALLCLAPFILGTENCKTCYLASPAVTGKISNGVKHNIGTIYFDFPSQHYFYTFYDVNKNTLVEFYDYTTNSKYTRYTNSKGQLVCEPGNFVRGLFRQSPDLCVPESPQDAIFVYDVKHGNGDTCELKKITHRSIYGSKVLEAYYDITPATSNDIATYKKIASDCKAAADDSTIG